MSAAQQVKKLDEQRLASAVKRLQKEFLHLDEELKRKWLAALRSNSYKQSKGVLRSEHGYCCLGVVCDLLPMGEWSDWRPDPEPSRSGDIAIFSLNEAIHMEFLLAPEMADVLFDNPELNTHQLRDRAAEVYDVLAGLNDDGATFHQIALVIEEGL